MLFAGVLALGAQIRKCRQALYERLQRKADARKAAESRERTYDDTYISRDANANDVQPESNRETPCQDTEIRVNVKKRHSTHQVFGELPESVEAYCGRQTKGEPTPSDGTITLTYSGPHDDHRTDSDTDNDDTPRPIPPALGVPTPPRKNSFGLHAMAPLYRGRISVLEAEKEVLLEMNATLRDENEALRRMTCLMTKGDASSLDVEQPNASNGDSRPSEISLLPRLSHGRLPSLATLVLKF